MSFLDYLLYSNKELRERDAKAALPGLIAKKKAFENAPESDLYAPEGPSQPLTPEEEVAMAIAYVTLGVNPNTQAMADETTARTAGLGIRNDMLERGSAATTDPTMLLNAGNKLTVAPRARVADGVIYDQYSGDLISETPGGAALTAKRSAEAYEQGLLNDALDEVLSDPTLSQSVRADVANRNSVAKSERIKVRGADGSEQYSFGTRDLSGTMVHTPEVDQQGKPLMVAPSASDRDYTLDKSPDRLRQEAWVRAGQRVEAERKASFKLDQRYDEEYADRRLTVFREEMNDESALPPGPNSPIITDTTQKRSYAPADDVRYIHARNALNRGANMDEVRKQMEAMGLDPKLVGL